MTMMLKELNPHECYDILRNSRLGHLACCKDGRPYVTTIYFSFSDGVAYSFTMPGKKLDWMRDNEKVCLHVEEFSAGGGWTGVIAEGRFEEFPDTYPDTNDWHSERVHAWSLLQVYPDWWEMGSMKPEDLPIAPRSPHVFYGIVVAAVSGRRATKIN